MSQFKDFSELADPLVLPINGKLYTIPPVSVQDGIRFNLAADPEGQADDKITDPEFYRMFLGTAYDEMLVDNIPGQALTRAAMAALADFQRGRQVAEIMWETGGDPKALTERILSQLPREQRRAAAKTSTRSAKASTTK